MTFRSILRRPILALVGMSLAGSAVFAQQQPMPDAQRGQIEAVIRDYLVKNPEVLQEAFAELERRQQAAQKVAQSAAVRELRGGLGRPGQIQAGNPNGDVTLVEFFDYNCGYCKRALGDVQALVKADPKLRIVLKDLPVLGPESVEASRVSLAVAQQIGGEKLFDYHVRLLSSRGRVGGERALAVAREMGVDLARVQRDMAGPAVAAAIQENAAMGEKLGLTGTPAFVVGEEVVSGAVGEGPLKAAIASVRQCGQASC